MRAADGRCPLPVVLLRRVLIVLADLGLVRGRGRGRGRIRVRVIVRVRVRVGA